MKRIACLQLSWVLAAGGLLLSNPAGAEPAAKLKIGISVPSATHGWTGGVVWIAKEKGANLMEVYLRKYPKIDAVWAGDDDVLIGARKALEGLRNNKQPVGGIRETLIKSEIVIPENARDHYFPDSVY
jgi:ABC-type sugar transport system substrate-binding protein